MTKVIISCSVSFPRCVAVSLMFLNGARFIPYVYVHDYN